MRSEGVKAGAAGVARAALIIAMCLPLGAQTSPAKKATSAGPASASLIEDLVAAYRILAAQGIFDAYGHVSVRHDRDPNRYLMARSLAPALVTAADIVEFDLDSRPVEGNTSTPVVERFIHGEIYIHR